MVDLDKQFAAMADVSEEDTAYDFVIDEDLRVIAVPECGVVLGVEGDKDVNRVRFRMNRYYRGTDLSDFNIRINYRPAEGEMNYFPVTEKTVQDERICFVWVVGADAVATKGTVYFVARFFTAEEDGSIVQEFNTTLGNAPALEGLAVEAQADDKPVKDLLAQLEYDLKNYAAPFVEQAKTSAENSARSAASSATSATQAGTYAGAAGTSAQNAEVSATHAEAAKKKAQELADEISVKVSTDTTLSVPGAPADAEVTGKKIKEANDALNIRYTKEETNKLLKEANPFVVGSIFQTVSFASPALTLGGIWSELDAGTVELPVKNMHIWERMGYLLNIRAIAGSALTITDGETTIEDTVDASGRYSRELLNTGTWTVTATSGNDVRTQTCTVDKYGVYTVELDWKIFGVVWDYGNPSTALTRLTKVSDPYHFVTTDITTEPVAAVGTGTGSSPFDSYMPWGGMEEYNIVNSAVGVKRGDQGFSRANDTVVFIPEFYYKVVDDADGQKRYFYISDKPRSEFEKHPGSGRYVGRYETGSDYSSKTGLAPLTNIYRSTFRENSMAKGAGWYQYDYVTLCAIWFLYLVEYADWDSQSKIGKGRSSKLDTYLSAGNTDTMVYHTGRASGTDGYTAVQYRHIENLWGNVITNLDGISFNGELLYACLDPSKFADGTAENYIYVGLTAKSSGYISKLGMSAAAPWSFFCTETSGSSSTYIPDNFGYNGSGWQASNMGSGTYPTGGLFSYGSCAFDNKWTSIGSRLIFVPPELR